MCDTIVVDVAKEELAEDSIATFAGKNDPSTVA
jgi:hypothetical protein